eukprot:TRINITY_DN1453_c0_g1_i3.p1 TRINITY_DN1453_c0_g1~~TRINITY_DN1453_c0_g1_i3.p1  ORF type:complete len:258 (-),score=54.93 TRINITY_DN1453_c0_g1_i3:51-824(-)
MKVAKNLADTEGSELYSVRCQSNTDLLFHGVTVRAAPTPTNKAGSAYKRLVLAATVKLEEADVAVLYKSKRQDQSISRTTHGGNRRAGGVWPNVTEMGHRTLSAGDGAAPGKYWCVLLETGCTKVDSAKPPTMTGHTVDLTFVRERASKLYPEGKYSTSYTVPPHCCVATGRSIVVKAQAGLTHLYVPLLEAEKQTVVCTTVQSWMDAVGGEAASDDGDLAGADDPADDPTDHPSLHSGDDDDDDDDDDVVYSGQQG